MKIYNGLGTTIKYSVLSFTTLMVSLQPGIANQRNSMNELLYDCLIEPNVIANLGSVTQGVVSRLLVDRGETVKRGQALVELDSSVARASRKQVAARADMLGDIITREVDLEVATRDSERFSQLQAKKLIPEQQYEEALGRKKVATAALVQALENRRLILLELDSANRVVDRLTIKSPLEGVVVEQHVFPGELVLDNPLLTVADIDPLRIEVVLPARLFGSIKKGDTALVEPEIYSKEPLLATVDVVDPLLDSRSGTFGVRLLLPNATLSVPAGQKCLVEFHARDELTGQEPDSDPGYPAAAEPNAKPANEETAGEPTVEDSANYAESLGAAESIIPGSFSDAGFASDDEPHIPDPITDAGTPSAAEPTVPVSDVDSSSPDVTDTSAKEAP